jgi:hypothetical protein
MTKRTRIIWPLSDSTRLFFPQAARLSSEPCVDIPYYRIAGVVAQRIEQHHDEVRVAGSNPANPGSTERARIRHPGLFCILTVRTERNTTGEKQRAKSLN